MRKEETSGFREKVFNKIVKTLTSLLNVTANTITLSFIMATMLVIETPLAIIGFFVGLAIDRYPKWANYPIFKKGMETPKDPINVKFSDSPARAFPGFYGWLVKK